MSAALLTGSSKLSQVSEEEGKQVVMESKQVKLPDTFT